MPWMSGCGSLLLYSEFFNAKTDRIITEHGKKGGKIRSLEIKINDYYEPAHFRSLNEDNYNLSRSCEYDKNEMHHIHEACELLFIEEGAADYYIEGKKYYVEPGDILIIGSRMHHMRRLDKLPFLRYGFSIKPSYFRSLNLGQEMEKIFQSPSPQDYEKHFKQVDPSAFQEIIHQIQYLYHEGNGDKPFNSLFERSIITEIAVILYRLSGLKQKETPLSPMYMRMSEIKEYIDANYRAPLDLNGLSQQFYLHPVTISKEFNKCFGRSLSKYINNVRICEGARLLETTQDSVTDIAQKCGYDNGNTFLRQFKAIMETTPLQYRKSIQQLIHSKQEMPAGILNISDDR